MNHLRALFQLEPDVVYLNHGAFGATPLPVFEVYQDWQRRIERQPTRFFSHEARPALRTAREALGRYVGARADDLVFVHNATFGVNVAARSLPLQPGDEVLTTTHEYGACNNAWEFVCAKRGAVYVKQPITLPITDEAQVVDQFWSGVTPRTRVIYLSHVTSPTALTLPLQAICQRAREMGITTVIDGAHAPGQLELDLDTLGADIYTGNLHKWLCAPKGAGFMWVRKGMHDQIEPLVVGWGYGPERGLFEENDYVSATQWLGTDDISAYLSVPAAIEFLADHNWAAVREQCHSLLGATLDRLTALTDLASPYLSTERLYHQMAVARLPRDTDTARFKLRLLDEYRIEIPCFTWQGYHFIRISVQGYNSAGDLDRLVEAVEHLIAGE